MKIQQNVADELSLTETDDDGQSEEEPIDMDSTFVTQVEEGELPTSIFLVSF